MFDLFVRVLVVRAVMDKVFNLSLQDFALIGLVDFCPMVLTKTVMVIVIGASFFLGVMYQANDCISILVKTVEISLFNGVELILYLSPKDFLGLGLFFLLLFVPLRLSF